MTGHPVGDAIVVGAGHNGLVAAAYLARAGRSVSVVERDTIPGGAVSTIERFPGYRVDRGSSAHLMIRHSPVLDELALADAGLTYLDCDPWAFCPATDTAGPIVFRTDLDATCASIERACGRPTPTPTAPSWRPGHRAPELSCAPSTSRPRRVGSRVPSAGSAPPPPPRGPACSVRDRVG